MSKKTKELPPHVHFDKARGRAYFERVKIELIDAKFQVKKADNGKLPMITGYAMVWNTLSSDRGGYKVKLLPNSGKPAADGPVMALCNHNYDQILGRMDKGTLSLTFDDHGVKCEVQPPETSYGRDMVAAIEHGNVDGMSFGMLYDGAEYTESNSEANGGYIREFSKFFFDEVTFTGIPAFVDTSAAVKDEDDEEEGDMAKKPPTTADNSAHQPAHTPERTKLSHRLQEMKLQMLNTL